MSSPLRSWMLPLAILVVAVLVTWQFAGGQQPGRGRDTGRFQLHVDGDNIYVMDSGNGQVWRHGPSGVWQSLLPIPEAR